MQMHGYTVDKCVIVGTKQLKYINKPKFLVECCCLYTLPV